MNLALDYLGYSCLLRRISLFPSKKQIIVIGAAALLAALHEVLLSSAALSLDAATLFRFTVIGLLYGGAAFLVERSSLRPSQPTSPASKNNEINSAAEALSDVGLMAAGLVHNFRNYLEVIEQTSHMLSRFTDHHGTILKAVTLQGKCLQQAKETANQILYFAKRQEKKEPGVRSINDVVAEAVELAELLLKDKNIQLVKDLEPNPFKVPINEISLMQSVVNLVKNAAQASPPNSKIIVSTRFTPHQHSLEFCVVVKDFGKGMNAETLQGLFAPFHTSSREGTGLGLYTVKRLIELDGGNIEVDSAEGSGTEITLRYPMLQ